jgi:hypothetical protein
MIQFQYYIGLKNCKPNGVISLEQFIQLIKDPKPQTKELLHKIATAPNKEVKNQHKEQLPKFTPCALVDKWRKYENIKLFTGLLILDFDNLEQQEAFTLKNSLFNNLGFVIASWLSPSKKGVKALINIPISKDVNEFKSYFKAIKNELGSVKGFDDTAQNPILDCFLSYDPNILYRTDATTWTEQYFEPVKVRKEAPLQVTNKTDVIAKIIIKNLNAITNAGHPILRAVSYSLGGYVGAGYISESDALNLIEGCIENHWYLSKNRTTYKKTASTMIEKGIFEPLYLDELTEEDFLKPIPINKPLQKPFFIDVYSNDDFDHYGLDENQQYFFTPEQIKAIEKNEEHLPVRSLLIQNQEEHFEILKFGHRLDDEPIKLGPIKTTVNGLDISDKGLVITDKELFLKTHKKAIESDVMPKYKDLFIQRLKDYEKRTLTP